MMRGIRLLSTLLFSVLVLFGQQFSKAIEDNSFFIEEAYNQENRVVQHIFTGYYVQETRDFISAFTQEWPVGGQDHQLSLTVAYQFTHAKSNGLGDAYINYRYQLWDEQNWGWAAPRLSIILPTGRTSKGLGDGAVGCQFNLPVSKRWSDEFITHFNAGVTVLPNAKGMNSTGETVRKTLPSSFIGASGIWLLAENFNILLEALQSTASAIDENGSVAYAHSTIINPGVRFALYIGRLQIVPGIGLPVVFQHGVTDISAFLYLSFEHPF
jgi:hypothetical protein